MSGGKEIFIGQARVANEKKQRPQLINQPRAKKKKNAIRHTPYTAIPLISLSIPPPLNVYAAEKYIPHGLIPRSVFLKNGCAVVKGIVPLELRCTHIYEANKTTWD